MSFSPEFPCASHLNRRDCLRLMAAAGLSCLPLALSAADGSGGWLPAAQSLRDELSLALRKKQPLLVMVSLEGCIYCKMARQSHLVPLYQDGAPVVQVDMRSPQAVLDFAGKPTTHNELTRLWKVTVTPTLLFFGPGGREVADRMEGGYLPDFYGSYLDDRLAKARSQL
jgi:thioredoxin-related protein